MEVGKSKSPNHRIINVDDFKSYMTKLKTNMKDKENLEKSKQETDIKEKLRTIKEKIKNEKSGKMTNFKDDYPITPRIEFVDEEPAEKPESTTTHRKRNIKAFQHKISEALKDVKEEKTIIPKKKINYVGLKMYLKEVMKK